MLTKGQKWIQKPTQLEGKREKMKNAKEDMEDKERSCKSYGGHMCLVRPFCQRRETWMPLSISFRHFHAHLCPSMMSPAHQSLKGEAPSTLPWGPSRLAQGCPELRLSHSCWPASALQGMLFTAVLAFWVNELKVLIVTTEIINNDKTGVNAAQTNR